MYSFPLVCIGGSAGGLDAYIRLLQCLPADLNVAVIIVNHITIAPTMLHEVLARFSAMPVELISEGSPIRVNRVYIIPSNRDLHIQTGRFQLKPISKPRGWPDVITVFFRSVIENWDGTTVAAILSGYDGDGAAAMCAIQSMGGITIAQRPSTAAHPDMPQSAISTGCVDFILSPEEIANEIQRISAASANSNSTIEKYTHEK
jgi:two-component system chemotaxis response regulator CheB